MRKKRATLGEEEKHSFWTKGSCIQIMQNHKIIMEKQQNTNTGMDSTLHQHSYPA